VQSFNDLGCGFDIEDARLVRDEPTQLGEMRVPKEHLLGHAFHTYKLTSPDGSVGFEFQHNVCGRSIYAEGTVDAALFLAQKTRSATSPEEETLFDMIDVLKEGGMVTN
jgi:4-hydroxy-tetrahydrodipicolinate reductase